MAVVASAAALGAASGLALDLACLEPAPTTTAVAMAMAGAIAPIAYTRLMGRGCAALLGVLSPRWRFPQPN